MKNSAVFKYRNNFELESGATLPEFQLEYTTYGRLNNDKSNVVWICHALTANADFTDWWPGLCGRGNLFDPDKYFVVCANALGGCYGSTGPLSENPQTGVPYFHSFPLLTNSDIVRAFIELKNHLEIDRIHYIIGGSLGGQQALEWAIQEPDVIERLVLIAANAQHSPWGIAFNETQRMAIEGDITWPLNSEKAGLEGLKTARAIALLSYRNDQIYQAKQEEEDARKRDQFKASSYQRYQGEKLAQRFNAFSYWILTKTMDAHHVGRNRGEIPEVLKKIKAKSLFIGISSDILFPVSEQKLLHKYVPQSKLEIIDSLYGHDGFLIETETLSALIKNFLNNYRLEKNVA